MGIISIGKVPRIGRGQPVEFILMLRPDLKADKLIKSRRINAKTGEGKRISDSEEASWACGECREWFGDSCVFQRHWEVENGVCSFIRDDEKKEMNRF